MSLKLLVRVFSIVLFVPLLGVQKKEHPPNIIFLLSDDHSVPYLGAYGYPINTPTLDKLAAEGMLFSRAFTTAPQCVPSRASLMTGRSAVAIQMTRFNAPLRPQYITLPEVLKKAGYFTGVCKRYFHLDGPIGQRDTINQRVIDQYGFRTFKSKLDFVQVGGPQEATSQVVNEFFDKLPPKKPFFLWVNFSDPHHPWDKDAVTPAVNPATRPVSDYLPDTPAMRQALADHCSEIERMDGEINRVLAILEKRGYSKNTIVVFMGDNGMAFPHGKGSLHDPGLNVPLIVKWPEHIKPALRTSELFSGEDLAPTLIDMAGITVPNEMSGLSFKKLLTGQPFTGRSFVFAERGPHSSTSFLKNVPSSGVDYSRCVRTKQYKLIYNVTPYQQYSPVDSSNEPYWKKMVEANKNGTLSPKFNELYFTWPRPIYELYDLEKDPAELTNLADNTAYKSAFNSLQAMMLEKMVIDQDYLPLPLEKK